MIMLSSLMARFRRHRLRQPMQNCSLDPIWIRQRLLRLCREIRITHGHLRRHIDCQDSLPPRRTWTTRCPSRQELLQWLDRIPILGIIIKPAVVPHHQRNEARATCGAVSPAPIYVPPIVIRTTHLAERCSVALSVSVAWLYRCTVQHEKRHTATSPRLLATLPMPLFSSPWPRWV